MNNSVVGKSFTHHELTDNQRQTALERYRIIEPFIKEAISLTTICKESNIAIRTARSWVCRYQKMVYRH